MSHTLRPDLATIAGLITPKARVLDIGCGDGELLGWLRDYRLVDGRGIEIDQELVHRAISRGIPVIQGDVASDLPHSKGGGIAGSSQASTALQLPPNRRPRGGRKETKR